MASYLDTDPTTNPNRGISRRRLLTAAGAAAALALTGCTKGAQPIAATKASPDSESTPTTSPSATKNTPSVTPEATSPSAESSANNQEAIEAAFDFAEAPLEERNVFFMSMAQKALDATDGVLLEVFSERIGSTGEVLAAYNPAWHPGRLSDTAQQIEGQLHFGKQLSHSMGQVGNDRKLDIPKALKVLAGVYFEPERSWDYPIEAGAKYNDFGITHETVAGKPINTGGLSGFAFDEKREQSFPAILDNSGKPYALHVVEYTTGKSTALDIVILVQGRWMIVDTATSDKTWDEVMKKWGTNSK